MLIALALILFPAFTLAAEDVFFIVSHAPLLYTRLDPIVNPGAVSGHVHAFIGGSGMTPEYNYDNLIKSKCTTANVAVDHSNYWMPTLYRKDAGKVFPVPMSYANTYYQMRRTGDEPVYEMPPGFRMLAGSATRNTLNISDPAQDAVQFVCLGRDGPSTHEFPTQNCPDGLRMQIYFPHCWDGVNNWLAGSKHVSYGAGQFDQGGICPPTHPKRIMGLFYEFIYKDDYPYVPGARVLSSGDDLGYSLHADFTNGWPMNLFTEIFSYGTECSVGFGLDQCPPLAKYLNVAGNGGSCGPENLSVDENIGWDNSLTQLPGNNPYWGLSGPKPAADTSYVENAQFTSVEPTVPADWTKLGCMAEPTGGRALTADNLDVDDGEDMSPVICINYCGGKGYKYAGIEYSKECYCGNDFSNGAAATTLLADTECGNTCENSPYGQGFCGGGSKLTIYEYSGGGTPVGGYTEGSADVAPGTAAGPTQILASDVIVATVKGDTPGQVVVGPVTPIVTGTATSSNPASSTSAVMSISTTSSIAPASAVPNSMASSSASISTSLNNPVLVGLPISTSFMPTSTSTATSSTASDPTCHKRSRKRSLKRDLRKEMKIYRRGR